MREPPFWWRAPGLEASALAPLAAIYGALAARRLARAGKRIGVPVICVGNPTIGGAGETPTVLALADMLGRMGERPVLLTRGYGGRLAGPVTVDPARHHARDVGDEPLLLARAAPTIVARDRVAGAAAALATGASVIVMDDGFQNPSLVKDLSLLVVDARRGIGNGRVVPAGPLRAPLAPQLDRAGALIVVGNGDGSAAVVAEASRRGLPVLRAALTPDADSVAAIGARRVLAFAGIGDPEKFFATLRDAGIDIAAARSFADHHRYTTAEARALRGDAEQSGLVLVTTEKDLARLQGDGATAELAASALALRVALSFDEPVAVQALLRERLVAASG